MLVKALWKGAKTDEEYRDVLKKRRYVVFVMMAAGAAAIGVSICLGLGVFGKEEDFLSGLYMGMGCGILAGSIMSLIKIRKTLQDEKMLRQKRLEESDERNIQVTQKAYYMAGICVMTVGYLVFLFAGFFSMEVFWTVWLLLMLYFLLFFVCRKIYDKKM